MSCDSKSSTSGASSKVVRFRRRPPGHPVPPGSYGPKPYLEPVSVCGMTWEGYRRYWVWFPNGIYNPRVWQGPGRPPATFMSPPGVDLPFPERYAFDWPLEGYQSVSAGMSV